MLPKTCKICKTFSNKWTPSWISHSAFMHLFYECCNDHRWKWLFEILTHVYLASIDLFLFFLYSIWMMLIDESGETYIKKNDTAKYTQMLHSRSIFRSFCDTHIYHYQDIFDCEQNGEHTCGMYSAWLEDCYCINSNNFHLHSEK